LPSNIPCRQENVACYVPGLQISKICTR